VSTESALNPTRVLLALVAWAVALGAAAGLSVLAGDYAASGHHQRRTPATSASRTPAAAPKAKPARDITRGLPSRPAGAAVIGAGSANSLFRLPNLERVLNRVRARVGAGEAVITLALYPGEADLVIANGGEARLVRAGVHGSPTVGPRTGFPGTRSAVVLSQIKPVPLERTLRTIATRGRVPTRRLDRILLDTSAYGSLAGYRIYPATGSAHFKSLLTGGRLEKIGTTGTRRLG
jgi:hypothetical protein